MERTLSAELAQFVAGLGYEALPAQVIDKAKTCLLHGLAVGLAGSELEYAHIARRLVVLAEPGVGEVSAPVIGSSLRASVAGAAFANGVILHGRVQEDTHGTAHPGTMIIPALLAASELRPLDGRAFLTALVAGYEVLAAVSRDFTALTTPRGFRASAIYGVFGAAAAAGKALALSEEQLAAALGLASAFAGGTTQSFASGTMEWHFENGVAARNGLLAALLAREGARASAIALEGPAGFYQAFAGTREGLDRVVSHLGRTWEILNVTFKPYPVCAFNQSPITAALELVRAHGPRPEEIARIELEMNAYEANYPGMAYTGPFTTVEQTQMSAPFCVAWTLAHRAFSFSALTQFDDEATRALISKLEMRARQDLPPLSLRLTVHLVDGRTLEQELQVDASYYAWDFARELELLKELQPDLPLTPEATQRLIELIRSLERCQDVHELTRLLAVPAPSSVGS
jgi:2-methylcitrate dehydratase PrpD